MDIQNDFIVNEIVVHDYVDEFILTKEEIEEYDIEKTLENIKDEFKDFKKARNKFINGYHVRLTTNYEPMISSHSSSYSNLILNSVEYNLDSEQEYNKFNIKLNLLYEIMSKLERAYINDCLISNKSETSVRTKFNVTRTTFDEAKNSSIIRCGIAFDKLVYKKNK
ncbi:MAG: hypothetical protein HFH47_00195 [Bacilli bacterium]|nr:hypothetical protein [Bacilli bacterium]